MWLHTGIAYPWLLEEPSRSPGPHRVGDAGGSRSRTPREPPNFTPSAGKSGSYRVGLFGRFLRYLVQQIKQFFSLLTMFWSSEPKNQPLHEHPMGRGRYWGLAWPSLVQAPAHKQEEGQGCVTGTARARGSGGSWNLKMALSGQTWQNQHHESCCNGAT